MPTARVFVSSGRGRTKLVRALLDRCSEVTIVSTSIERGLNAIIFLADKYLSGVSGEPIDRAMSKTTLQFQIPGRSEAIPFTAYCLGHFGLSTPSMPAEQDVNAIWRDRKLADPLFHISDVVDLLIGSDVLPSVLRPGFTARSGLVAENSDFGWVISGRTPARAVCDSSAVCTTSSSEEKPL